MLKRTLVTACLMTLTLAAFVPAATVQEFRTKVEQVRSLLKENQLSGLLISQPRNFAWLTGGGDSTASLDQAAGTGSLVVTPRQVYVIGTADRVKRLLEQELLGLDIRSMPYYWYEEFENNEPVRLAQKIAPGKLGADLVRPGTEPMEEKLRTLQRTLDRFEIKRYRELGPLAAAACEAAAQQAKGGMSEEEIAGLAARELRQRGLTPLSVEVGVDEDAESFREPLPQNRVLKRLLRVRLTARKWGLVASVSRTVYLGKLPGGLEDRQQVGEKLFAASLNSLQPGGKLQELYDAVIQFYKELKLRDEWRVAPLGCATGYREREFEITPSTTEAAQENQAYAFAPTLEGVRVEDTVLLTADGVEILTTTGKWPVREIEMAGKKFQVPTILVKNP
jgi:Xaa-Pro dipeptidase